MRETQTISLLSGKRILLGVTGSIAAYKASELASRLTQAGAEVEVILTAAARYFITPLSFQSLTGRRAYTEADLWGAEAHVLHVGLAEGADAFLIAPATANTIAELAQGSANNLLTLTALAARCPIIVAPAMDSGMYDHPATQANLATLAERGVTLAGPAEGRMASGLIGKGRMLEASELLGTVRWVLGRAGPLAGVRVVVTAGGTKEPMDPVRAITNRSSGKQGFALAQAAVDRGAEVELIASEIGLETPIGLRRTDVSTAREMLEATLAAVQTAEVLIMAAAVADFRPTATSDQKMKRKDSLPELTLEATEDILQAVVAQRAKVDHPSVLVGFAAESKDLESNAREKMTQKGLDLIVANDITAEDAGFGSDHNRVLMLDAAGGSEQFPLMPKTQVAELVLDRIVKLIAPE